MIFSVFYLIEVLIRRGTFCWKPHLIGAVVPKLYQLKDYQTNRKENKCMNSYFWLYLTISARNFRLILLDCNTNMKRPFPKPLTSGPDMLLIWSLGHSKVTNFQHKIHYKWKMLILLGIWNRRYQQIKKIIRTVSGSVIKYLHT